MTSRPIADYAMLSDCDCAALVSGGGSVDWVRRRRPLRFRRLLPDPDNIALEFFAHLREG